MKNLICLGLCLALAALSPGCGSHIYEKDGFYISRYAKVSSHEWQIFDRGSNRFASPREFLEEVDCYVEVISEYLGLSLPPTDDVRLLVEFRSTQDKSACDGWIIYLNLDAFIHGIPPIAHELTHYLALSDSSSLSEGLAELIQAKFSKNPPSSVDRRYKDIYGLSKEFLRGTEYDLEYIAKIGLPAREYPEEEELNRFYILSHSFTRYLIDQYGVEKYMQVYKSKRILAGYEEVYGRNLDQLKGDWLEFILVYPGQGANRGCRTTGH